MITPAPERIDIEPGKRYLLPMPASEVMIYMGLVDELMEVELLPSGGVQLFKDGKPYSLPVLPGEAGMYDDHTTGQYYAYAP